MMKELRTGTYIKGEETHNFNFYTELTAAKKVTFVNSVVKILIDDSYYNSIIRDLIFDFFVIDVFTEIDTSEMKVSPTFLNDIEEFLEETNIVNIVKSNAKVGLIDELNNAVNLAIEYRTGIHVNSLNEALTNLVNTIEKKINNIDLDSMMDMATKFSGITGEFTPESIMKAYMTTDIFKKNMSELEESKKLRAEFANDMNKAIKDVTKK